MYVYIVVAIALIVGGFFIFLFSTVIGSIQTTFNPMLGNESWVDQQHFNVFNLAAQFVTNYWLFLPALLILGLMYWGWVYTQRKNAGG